MYGAIEQHLSGQLDEIKKAGLFKGERVLSTAQQPHVAVQGSTDVLNMCANNYLGLANHPEVVQAAREALDRWGNGLASVRFICGTQEPHKALEAAISGFLGMEDTILYSSCWDANGGLFETILGAEDAVISDELNHASIIDGVRLCKAKRLRYKNNDMADLEQKLEESRDARFRLIATDGVFSMDGIIANLASICDLGDKYDALVMVDDSHAVGFMGKTGRGTHEYCNVMGRVDIITGTLGKALGGASGGYTSAHSEIITMLRQRSRPYLFSNSVAPPIVGGSLKALEICTRSTELRDRLESNTKFFRAAMTERKFNIVPGEHPITPIMIGDAALAGKMADRLLANGVYAIGFFYPVVPQGKARVRVQVSAAHSRQDLDFAIGAFTKVRDELGYELPPMLIAYVSDERYVALPDVVLEFEGDAGSFEAQSRATGSVHLDLPPGPFKVTLQKPGFGAKSVNIEIAPGREPYQLRLLADGLLGYAWPKWVRAGEKSEFRVHSVEPYHLSLWRYGINKELIREIGWFDEHGPRATMQITPDGDYTRSGVEWNKHGYANPILHQYVHAPDRSGLYYFHARTKSGAEFSFPWIVAPSRPTAPVAVLASNITWNAYNSFGGRSNYINPDRLPPRPTVNARLELKRYTDPDNVTYDTEDYAPLSFDRPEPINHIDASTDITDPIEGRAACHIAPAEWRLLGWLEREHFAFDYYAETQLHDGTLDLSAYKVLILSTHPEYWSRTMYDKVKSWVNERGGKLMYLGGNGLNCEVELVGAAMSVYHNGDARVMKRGAYESRFHMRVESEASLLGVVFTESGVMTGAPYRVLDAGHWAFAETGLSAGDLFGQTSLHRRCPGGASGHETDKVSPSSPKGVVRLAKGTNIDDGGAELIYYDTPSGGAVFSAGSIAWPSAILVDNSVSQITANVIKRFQS